jgi:hypothetical protein
MSSVAELCLFYTPKTSLSGIYGKKHVHVPQKTLPRRLVAFEFIITSNKNHSSSSLTLRLINDFWYIIKQYDRAI